MRPCHMTAVTTSQLWFLDLQVYNMLVNVLKILLKTLLYSLNNVFESLILLNTYLLENTKIIDMFFWAVLTLFEGEGDWSLCDQIRKCLGSQIFSCLKCRSKTSLVLEYRSSFFPSYRKEIYRLWGRVFVTDNWTYGYAVTSVETNLWGTKNK